MIQPLRRTVWRLLKKPGIKQPYAPTIPLLGMHPGKIIIKKDTLKKKKTHVPSVDYSTIYNSYYVEAT